MGYQKIVSGVFNEDIFNDNVTDLEAFHHVISGRGVISGLAISAGTAFTINISAGEMMTGKKWRSSAGATHNCPPSASRFIWIDGENNDFILDTASSADPGGNYVPLGKVTCDGSGVTVITTEGRASVARYPDLRTFQVGENTLIVDTLNSRIGVNKTPLYPLDVSGAFNVDALFVDGMELNSANVSISNMNACSLLGGF